MSAPCLARVARGFVGGSALLLLFAASEVAREYDGRVIDRASGQPVGGAIVTAGDAVTTAEPDGTFRISGRADRIRVRAPGYLRTDVSAGTVSSAAIALTPFRPKALYLSDLGIGSKVLRERALRLIEETELNALVIDVKGDWGRIPYESTVPLAAEIGALRGRTVVDMGGLIEKLRRQGIYTIARIVVFKDAPLSRARPDLAVKRPDGTIWHDREHLSWTDPFRKEVWAYNIDLAVEAAELGFDEIQFDYVRFPDAKGLSFAAKSTQASRIAAIGGFLSEARRRLAPHNVFLAADVFGYVCWNLDDTMIGQKIEVLMPVVDYLSPMLYPSSFQFGIPGYRNPVAHPYEIVYRSLERAIQRTAVSPARFRPWLQAFKDYAFDRRRFGGEEISAQIAAAEEIGTNGWMLWNARNAYSSDGLRAQSVRPQ